VKDTSSCKKRRRRKTVSSQVLQIATDGRNDLKLRRGTWHRGQLLTGKIHNSNRRQPTFGTHTHHISISCWDFKFSKRRVILWYCAVYSERNVPMFQQYLVRLSPRR
jgi:hypothetical protein